MNDTPHKPVLLREVVEALAPQEGGVYVDGTFGRGGYARAILDAAKTTVYGIDRDPEAIEAAKDITRTYGDRFKILQGPFGVMDVLLAGEQVRAVDGITLDLGVSSPQLDDKERGFSFQGDGPLDMRMSKSGPTAADIVNTTAEDDLANIIYKYGEERFSRRVAKRIAEARATKRISRTLELAEIVRGAVPRSGDGIDPATRTFQALRLYVNDELGELERGLHAAEKLLKPKGRLAVVTFHSLEDRIVKDFLRQKSGETQNQSRYMPANDTAPAPATFDLPQRKPINPTDEEIRANPRARSAKLRVAIRNTTPCFTSDMSRQGEVK